MRNRRGKMNVWTTVLTALMVLITLTLVVWIFGGVSGQEFSPQRFTMRNFRYYQLPLIRVQIWPVALRRVRGERDEMAKFVRSRRWVGSTSAENERWDIITMEEVGRNQIRGDASILTNYLTQPGAVGTDSWLDWSRKNTQIAARLWPLAARLAHEEMYELIPDVFDAARTAASAEDFDATVREQLAASMKAMADAERVANNEERATRLASLAEELDSQPLPFTNDEAPAEDVDDAENDATPPVAEADPAEEP